MKNSFSHNILLAIKQVTTFCKAFANSSLKDIKSSKTQLSKIIQSESLLSRLLGPLMKVGLTLMKNILTLLAKIVLISIGLTAAVSAVDIGIYLLTNRKVTSFRMGFVNGL